MLHSRIALLAACTLASNASVLADDNDSWPKARAVLQQYCIECHDGLSAAAEVDLGALHATIDTGITDGQPVDSDAIKKWLRIREMLSSGQMPPPESEQLSDKDFETVTSWLKKYLRSIAEHGAGDPGPVWLRRLTNSEYNYTIRDLTGVLDLDPTREFPVDGAAGEGFTNVGSGQGMSPAMVQKYLDAAKEVASHLVLLPEGIGFSPAVSRRDRTDELIARIQEFYNRYTSTGAGQQVDLQGVKFATNEGGVLPLAQYFETLLADEGGKQIGSASNAGTHDATHDATQTVSLSPRYLTALRSALESKSQNASGNPWLRALQRQWETIQDGPRSAGKKIEPLMAKIADAQIKLWKFNTIGLLRNDGTPPLWAEPVSTLTTSQEIRVELSNQLIPAADEFQSLDLNAYGLGHAPTKLRINHARLEFPTNGMPQSTLPIPISQVEVGAALMKQLRTTELNRSATYLKAIAEHRIRNVPLEQLATQFEISLPVLERWADWLDEYRHLRAVTGHFTEQQMAVAGYAALNGLGSPNTPSILANSSDSPIQHQSLFVPAHGIAVHPSPALDSFIAWQSPVNATVTIEGKIVDTDPNCGNGVVAKILKVGRNDVQTLVTTDVENGATGALQISSSIAMAEGDILWLIVSARNNDHICDTTQVELTIQEVASTDTATPKAWDLGRDVSPNILSGNPLGDAYGHSGVWHLGAMESKAANPWPIPEGSSLAKWAYELQTNSGASDLEQLASNVQSVFTSGSVSATSLADQQLTGLAADKLGPLQWLWLTKNQLSSQLGRHDTPLEFNVPPDGPFPISVKIPIDFVDGSIFIFNAEVLEPTGAIQLTLPKELPEGETFSLIHPVLIGSSNEAREIWEAKLSQFRELFPPALCYYRIVPVDEVVTMVLFHREDKLLKQWVLSDEESAELDRLWDHLLFVSQEPLQLSVAYEQIVEFATQDRPDLENIFRPLKPKIDQYAEAFRQRSLACEPIQLKALIDFASKAWRRPLTDPERKSVATFYRSLRDEPSDDKHATEAHKAMGHEEALQWTLVSILTAPQFLYKVEQPSEGTSPSKINEYEFASRLSYFLWSTAPDSRLLELASAGKLREPEILKTEVDRMLTNPKIQRMAVEFACQWLHIRDFDRNSDKNEALFPEFADLRGDMYKESVLFFTDLFQRDGAILEILDADHTFVNSRLAAHYGIPWPDIRPSELDDWMRIDGVRRYDRGGMLGMATTLASQSGASRTSPILRGNWVYETVLGEKLPKPPPGVPILPEEVPDGLTDRQLIEQHSSVEGCARCHRKIDPYGFALEQFDPIGRRRPQTVDTLTKLPNGQMIEGLAGLRTYLANERRDDFVRHFCRKLLGYALGREIQLSDEPLLDELMIDLGSNEYRFASAVAKIVASPQFNMIRGTDFVSE